MEYLKVIETLEDIEQTINSKYKESCRTSEKSSSFPSLHSHKMKSTLNMQIHSNKLKSTQMEKLKSEVEMLRKSSNCDKKLETLQSQLENIEDKSKSLKKCNKEYEFVKKRLVQERTELKKKLQTLQLNYEKISGSYPKVIASKDQAYSNLNYIKKNLDEFEEEKKHKAAQQDKELKEKLKLKDKYTEQSSKLIKKLGKIVYQEKLNSTKSAETFEQRQKDIWSIQESYEKTQKIRKLQENTSNSLSTLNELLIERHIDFIHSPSESILSILKLYTEEEYKSISLSLKFNDLSSTIQSKKSICESLKAELHTYSKSFKLNSEDKDQLNGIKMHKDFPAESQACKVYAQIFSFASNVFGKLKIIEENSPDHLKKVMPSMDLSNNSAQNTARIQKKRSMNFIHKTKTITKSKTIRDSNTKTTIIDKTIPFNQISTLSEAFSHYKLISQQDLQFFLTNPVVVLCLKPGDVLEVIKNPSGPNDFVKLYRHSHSNMKYFIERIINKLTDAVINAKELIPEDFIPKPSHYHQLSLPRSSNESTKIKFSIETPKTFDGKSSEEIRKNTQKLLKFYSENSTPVNATINMTDTIRELCNVNKRLRRIESSEKKAQASNKLIRNEMNKYKSMLPNLY